MQRATFRLKDRRGNPVGNYIAFGKSRKTAIASGKRYLKNITAAFHDDEGFHPIRASSDYNPTRLKGPEGKRARKALREKGSRKRKRGKK